jgi:hypothetical protein
LGNKGHHADADADADDACGFVAHTLLVEEEEEDDTVSSYKLGLVGRSCHRRDESIVAQTS